MTITDQVIHIVKDTDITSEVHDNDWYSRVFAAGCDGMPTKECLKRVRDIAKYEQEEIIKKVNEEMDRLKDIVNNIVLLRTRSSIEFTVHTLADQNISDGEYGCDRCFRHIANCECHD